MALRAPPDAAGTWLTADMVASGGATEGCLLQSPSRSKAMKAALVGKA
jgi:hypothetical protein